MLPATNQAELHLMPVALDRGSVQMPVTVAQHHSIRLHLQGARRRHILVCGRFMRLLNLRHSSALLGLQLDAEAFGVGA